ncbi:MAG TPA: general stress protein [Kofleriaceae bacterium]|nr:general stress protein [Kofleriaceae bacterium]
MTTDQVKHDKKIVVFGLFDHRAQVEAAIESLRTEGFRESDMSALLPDLEATKELAHEKHTKAPEGALTGAAAGGVLGGTLGLLLGIGALAIPGLGPFIAAGPIMATLAGAGVGGAVGTLTGALVGMGIPEYEAKRYESFLNKGGALLAVHADDGDWAKRAKVVLDRCGAHDIDKTSEASGKKPD